MLRHQFPKDKGQVSGGDDHHGEGDAFGEPTDLGEGREPGLQMSRDLGAAEHAGEHADEGDPDLHGGQEALRIVRQGAGGRGALDALPLQHREAGPADRDQGQFTQREQPIQHDQQQDDEDFEAGGHSGSGWRRHMFNANCSGLS